MTEKTQDPARAPESAPSLEPGAGIGTCLPSAVRPAGPGWRARRGAVRAAQRPLARPRTYVELGPSRWEGMSGPRGALFGLLLAVGAPLGWLLIRVFTAGELDVSWVLGELRDQWALYAYLLLTTGSMFAVFGSRLGAQVRQQRESALADPLTGLPNRRAFEPAVAAALGRGPAAMLLIDLDRFKQVNDERGHAAGDALLVAASQALAGAMRVGDVCARLGGDEFAVLLPGTSPLTAYSIGERVLSQITPVLREGHPACSASVGVAGLPRGGAASELMALADQAMYRAKKDRGRVSA